MTFNKEEYRKNREQGKRGQGELPTPDPLTPEKIEKSHKEGSHLSNIAGRITHVNREQSRNHYVNRHFTNGKKLPKTKEVAEAISERVKRKESGEQERLKKLRETKYDALRSKV